MKRPAVFFDRDNTLIVCDGYLGEPAKVVLVDGAADAVAKVRSLGYAAVVFSNQSGVARGIFGEDAVHAVNARLDDLLLEDNPSAVIDRHEFCPYHPQAPVERYRRESDLRKPAPGMIHQAARLLALDLGRSWAVGDTPRDIEAGHAAGCRTVLIKDPALRPSPAALRPSAVRPDFEAATLREAVEIIHRHPAPSTPDEPDRPGPAADAGAAKAVAAGTPIAPTTQQAPETSGELATPPASLVPSKPASGGDDSVQSVASPIPLAAAYLPAAVVPSSPVMEPMAAEPLADPARAATLPADEHPPAVAPVVGGVTTPAEIPETPPRPAAAPLRPDPPDPAKLEQLAEQILRELRHLNEGAAGDFSISKVMAGIVQVLALATLFFAALNRDKFSVDSTLLLALVFQSLTIALLLMGRLR